MKRFSLALVSVLIAAVMFGSVTASAVFISSPIANGGLNIVDQEYDGGNYKALIVDNSGKVIAGVPDGEIIITPYSEIDSAPEPVDVESFRRADRELESAKSLKELNSAIADNAVLKDFFYITVTGKSQELLNQGNKLRVSFKIGKVNGKFKVLARSKGTWVVVEGVQLSADGVATMVLDEDGSVVFIVEPTSGSKTSDDSNIMLYSIIAGASLLCLAGLFISRKKSSEAKA